MFTESNHPHFLHITTIKRKFHSATHPVEQTAVWNRLPCTTLTSSQRPIIIYLPYPHNAGEELRTCKLTKTLKMQPKEHSSTKQSTCFNDTLEEIKGFFSAMKLNTSSFTANIIPRNNLENSSSCCRVLLAKPILQAQCHKMSKGMWGLLNQALTDGGAKSSAKAQYNPLDTIPQNKMPGVT